MERAFSHYLMDYRLGLVSENFEDIINKDKSQKCISLLSTIFVSWGILSAN